MRSVIAFLVLVASAQAATTVTKVDPPNWWTGHTLNPVQILLTGSDLANATVTAPTGLSIKTRQISRDGRYLFAYLDIPKSAKPGTYKFQIKSPAGTASFDFRLDQPVATKGRFQGLSADDTIYLLMPDRFANGDPSNDSPAGLGAPANPNVVMATHGGDFHGIRDHLPYLKSLGVTGIWLTPVTKNSVPGTSAYHGYHASDFYAVEPRFGNMSEYRELVDAAHALGIKVVQDQVANHTGPNHPWVKAPPTPTWFHGLETLPRTRNNYDIAGLSNPYSRPKRRESPLDYWFAGHLPDLNQDDPLVTDYLIQNAIWWIGMTGVDGVRQDTYPYVDRPFWEKWQTAIDRQFPGFFVTGEVTARTPAALSFFEGGRRHDGVDTKLPSLLDFPLESAMRHVFGEGSPMTELSDILGQDSIFLHPEKLVAFFDNHDGPRFLTIAGGDTAKLKMAQAFLLTIPRIPHLYYGDEIAMGKGPDRTDLTIRADFPVPAFDAPGRTGDAADVYGWTAKLLALRKEAAALRGGKMTELLIEKDRYAYIRQSGKDVVLVVLNRAGAGPINLDLDDVGLDKAVFVAVSGPEPEKTAKGIALKAPATIGIYRSN